MLDRPTPHVDQLKTSDQLATMDATAHTNTQTTIQESTNPTDEVYTNDSGPFEEPPEC